MPPAIPDSPTIRINALVQRLKAEGHTVFNLGIGEPVIETPEVIRAAAKRAIDEDKTTYPPAAGIPELRQAIAQWLCESYSCSYTPDEIVVTPGGKSALFFLFQTLLNPGDDVMIVAPYWVSYPAIVGIFGGSPIFVETNERDQWKVTPELLESKFSEQTALLVLNNASNPTGVVYTRTELSSIVEWAKDKGIMVISDEVYSGLVYEGEFVSLGSFSYENILVVQSASKNFGMTGWRIGILAGNAGILKKVTALLGQSVSGVSTISQWALLEGIIHRNSISSLIHREFKTRRDACVRLFEELFGTKINLPASGLYVFIPISTFEETTESSVEWCERILQKTGVATIPGSAFGCEGYVRLSFGGNLSETEGGLRALAAYVKK